MKTFFFACLILIPVVAFSAPAGEGYQRAARGLEDMMAEFMHIDKPKPTIALEAAQTVKAEENYKKGLEDMMADFMHLDKPKPTIALAEAQTVKAEENYKKGLEEMMAEFMHLDKPKPTIALAEAQTVKAEQNYKKVVEDEKLTEVLEDLETNVLLLKIRKMVEEVKKDLWAKADDYLAQRG